MLSNTDLVFYYFAECIPAYNLCDVLVSEVVHNYFCNMKYSYMSDFSDSIFFLIVDMTNSD